MPILLGNTGNQTVLLAATKTPVETINPSAGIHDLVLASVERVRLAGGFQLDQRILLAVFPLDGFLAAHGRAGQKLEITRDVLEHHFLILRVNVCFHHNFRCLVGAQFEGDLQS